MVFQIQLTLGAVAVACFMTAHLLGQDHGEERARFGIASSWVGAALVAIHVWS